MQTASASLTGAMSLIKEFKSKKIAQITEPNLESTRPINNLKIRPRSRLKLTKMKRLKIVTLQFKEIKNSKEVKKTMISAGIL